MRKSFTQSIIFSQSAKNIEIELNSNLRKAFKGILYKQLSIARYKGSPMQPLKLKSKSHAFVWGKSCLVRQVFPFQFFLMHDRFLTVQTLTLRDFQISLFNVYESTHNFYIGKIQYSSMKLLNNTKPNLSLKQKYNLKTFSFWFE